MSNDRYEGSSVNSKEYWENRFSENDWNKYEGDKQSKFFSQVAVNAFPEWFKEELHQNQWDILDVGCAEGDGTAVLARNFPSCHIVGMDFSDFAIQRAKAKVPNCDFITGDATAQIEPVDVVFSSNTLEHLNNPRRVLENFCQSSQKYTVLLLPFEDHLGIKEHINIFVRSFFPVKIHNCYLKFYTVIDCTHMEPTYWPGKQILLIYVNGQYQPPEKMSVETIYRNYIRTWEQQAANFAAKLEQMENLKAHLDTKIKALEKQTLNLSDSAESLNQDKLQLTNNVIALSKDNQNLKTEISRLQNENNTLQLKSDREKQELQTLISKLREEKKKLQILISDLNSEKASLIQKNADLQQQCEIAAIKLQTDEQAIRLARELCYALVGTKLFKMVHFISRLKRQGIHGSREERKKFRKWFFSRFSHVPNEDHRYNPVFGIIHILDQALLCPNTPPLSHLIEASADCTQESDSPFSRHLRYQRDYFKEKLSKPLTKQAKTIQDIIRERNYKGIIVYPHVVYWEPLQTPQQLLRAFAKEGWLCFFCEHPETPNAFREVEPNLFVTYESDFLQAVGDTHVTVLLTWMGSMAFVEKIANKTIWYHLLDHLKIFSYYNQEYLKMHNRMAKEAEYVSYVAKPLTSYFSDRTDGIYLPNGCNPGEFLNEHSGYIPHDMKNIVQKGHKIIGYYGCIAEWMDYDMVRAAALARPEYEFVFIGDVMHDITKIERLPNVHLLGRKPYKELSDYAKSFDVAIIPFLVNEQMDCVSSTQFYEYCALGLPVVSSYMPEVEAHACDSITCVESTEQFLSALDRFTLPEVKKDAQQHGPKIAEQNTWLSRAVTMQEAFQQGRTMILKQPYQKYDVIILSIIDYDFRYQRPQQFASRFAANGHRVFYINANHFRENSVEQIKDNLFVVNFKNSNFAAIHLTDWSKNLDILKQNLDGLIRKYCIRDAIAIVDYPNWVHGAEYLRQQYGFKFVADYMDDFTGFLNPANKLVKQNCIKLLEQSDMVIPSSQFLYEIAIQYNKNCAIVRNGGEYEHFHKAFGVKSEKERKIIGYYGAIAEWFDADKVCYLAEHLPECDLVLIGEVTAGKEEFEKHKNIKLTGEMPYDKLPDYLKTFDVCIIPFDTKTNLIKATNPVKFYEYLSAGKKIVATEIPELKPYKDKFVYLANDNEQFLAYIQLCLNGKDTLENPEECAAFGKENDWQVRYDVFAELCRNAVPKVSIIVLTYNNLALNKQCIQSILNKTAYPRYELIIVDNLSTDGTREYLQTLKEKAIPNTKIILNDDNKGFAGGNNVGIRAADGDYILLLNNDTIVTRGWITALTKHMENNPKLGMCGPVTNSIGNEAKIRVNYSALEEIDRFAEQYTWEHLGQEWKNPDRLALFCTLIKREIIDTCGFLDESYKVGMFEDDDYSEAVKRAGYSLTIAEDAFIHHEHRASFNKLQDAQLKKIFDLNRNTFEKKWNTKWQYPTWRPGITQETNRDSSLL